MSAKLGHYTMIGLMALALMGLGLSGCSQSEIILPGERVAITPQSPTELAVALDAADARANLPPHTRNASFPSAGGTFSHQGGHFAAEFPLQRLFSVSVGIGANIGTDMAQPVVNDSAVFTITPGGVLVASAVQDGRQLWAVDIDPSSDTTQVSISGGLGLVGTTLIAHAGKDRLVSLNATTGAENWSIELPQYITAGPSIASGYIIVVDATGRIYAFAEANGEELWNRIGTGIDTRITGAAYPAIRDGEVIIASGDGDIIALRLADGGFNWGDSLIPDTIFTALDAIADITAHPVHTGEQVIAVSGSGLMAAYNAYTGRRQWQVGVRALTMPWLAGETLFVTTINNELLALSVSDGAVRWQADLPGKYDRTRPVAPNTDRHTGAVVLGDKVMVANQRGNILIFDAETGAVEPGFSAPAAVTTPPAIANGTVFVLDRTGRLTAWR